MVIINREYFDIKLNDINTVKELMEKIAENKTAQKNNFCIHLIHSIKCSVVVK